MVSRPTIVRKGNAKLGAGVHTVSLSAGASCPGASDWCAAHCYAKAIQTRRPNVRDAWARDLELLRSDPDAYEASARFDVAKLSPGSVLRIHVSGDFESPEHVQLWARIARDYPELKFYAYSRSWGIPAIARELEAFDALENVTIWASTDESMPAPAEGWREARIFETETDARSAGYAVCPEQTGKRASCSDCGLCWKAKPAARLAFVNHANLRPIAARHEAARS